MRFSPSVIWDFSFIHSMQMIVFLLLSVPFEKIHEPKFTSPKLIKIKALILVVYSLKIFTSLQIKAPYTFVDCWLFCRLCWNISWTWTHVFANLLLEFCLIELLLNKYLFSTVFIYIQPMRWPSVAGGFKLVWKLRRCYSPWEPVIIKEEGSHSWFKGTAS